MKPQEKHEELTPSVSIGCDQVLWNDSEAILEATIKNIDKPLYQWESDGNHIGTSQTLLQKFGIGEHMIRLNVTFDNQTISAKKSILIIDSVEGINIRENAASKNQWGFQTMFKGKSTGVKGVILNVDSLSPFEVNACGWGSTKALFSGNYTWNAKYHGVKIASGTFIIKETSELRIDRIEIAPSYTAGGIVKARVIVKNTGSVPVTGFGTKALIVNENFAWMGDKAKREFSDQYKANMKPGDTYEIPIEVDIPEKVNGIRPSGKYAVTYSILMNEKIFDTKIVNTVVK